MYIFYIYVAIAQEVLYFNTNVVLKTLFARTRYTTN